MSVLHSQEFSLHTAAARCSSRVWQSAAGLRAAGTQRSQESQQLTQELLLVIVHNGHVLSEKLMFFFKIASFKVHVNVTLQIVTSGIEFCCLGFVLLVSRLSYQGLVSSLSIRLQLCQSHLLLFACCLVEFLHFSGPLSRTFIPNLLLSILKT